MKYFVYCLMSKGEIVYIGSSTKLMNRIKTHKKDKEFDEVMYCELLDRQTMLDFEIYAINKVKPPLNRVIPFPTTTEKPEGLLWKRANLSFLCKERVDIYHMLDQNLWWEYLCMVCDKFSICNIDPYNEWGLTYLNIEGKIVAVFDGTGVSLEYLAAREGVISWEDYRLTRYKEECVIPAEEYDWSLTQFD